MKKYYLNITNINDDALFGDVRMVKRIVKNIEWSTLPIEPRHELLIDQLQRLPTRFTFHHDKDLEAIKISNKNSKITILTVDY